MRTAVYHDLSPAERGAAHLKAARVLAERGAEADRVAAHLLLAPVGAAWAVGLLRDAGARAAALGAPATAAAYLERALLELDRGPERVELLIELGEAGLAADLPAATGHLRQAVELAACATISIVPAGGNTCLAAATGDGRVLVVLTGDDPATFIRQPRCRAPPSSVAGQMTPG